MEWVFEPLAFSYMRNALWVAAAVSGICALLSVFLLVKGWSLVGDTLSHSVLPGVAIAYILALPYAIGAFFTGALAMLAMLGLKKLTFLREDAVMAFVLTGFFALGLLLISVFPTAINLEAVIYGNLLVLSGHDVLQIAGIFVLTVLVLSLKWREFRLVFFDRQQARLMGLADTRLLALFFALLTIAVVASLQVVGAILTVALIIMPAASAYLWSVRFARVLCLAFVIGVGCAVLGVYLSYFLDWHSGALMVVLQSAVFFLSLLCSPRQGIIVRFLRKSA